MCSGGCGVRGSVCTWREQGSTPLLWTCTSSSWVWSSTLRLTASPPWTASGVRLLHPTCVPVPVLLSVRLSVSSCLTLFCFFPFYTNMIIQPHFVALLLTQWCFSGKGTVPESFSKPSLLPVRSLNEIFIGESLSSRYLNHSHWCTKMHLLTTWRIQTPFQPVFTSTELHTMRSLWMTARGRNRKVQDSASAQEQDPKPG